jgi:hypothetical protein
LLDKYLATFYEVKPSRLREQVKRNPNRFPDDFVFSLNEKEVENLVSQNAIPSKQSLRGAMPIVFTEQDLTYPKKLLYIVDRTVSILLRKQVYTVKQEGLLVKRDLRTHSK